MDITPFKGNRARLLAALPPGSAALVHSGSEQFRNRDADYPFRVHSDFYCLAGFTEPDSTLLLIHAENGETQSIVFVRPRDRKAETWTGRRLGVERAPEGLGVDTAHPSDKRDETLVDLLKGVQQVYVSFSDSGYWWPVLQPVFAGLKKHLREGIEPPQALQDLDPILHEHRLIKQPWELERLRTAAQITVQGHLAAMQSAPRAQTERAVQHALTCAMQSAGADDLSFNPIVASGANACILHYTENSAPLDANGLLLVDAGAEKDFYAGDITTTFPASGRFTAEQKAIYEVVLAAQQAALEQVRPGIPYDHHHEAAVRVLTEGLVSLGLLKGDVTALIEEKAYTRFYMHKTGHWLGLDVHDVGAYRVKGAWRPLEENMVLTVEPGLYVAPDDDTVEARWRGIGVRIEDDVRVTADGCEILTHGLPRTPEAIETWMQG